MNLAMVTKFCSFQCMVVAGRRRLAAVSRQHRPTHCICQVAPMCIRIMHGGLRPTQVCSQKWHLGRFFRFCRAEVTVVTNTHTDHAVPPVARGRMCTMHARRPKKLTKAGGFSAVRRIYLSTFRFFISALSSLFFLETAVLLATRLLPSVGSSCVARAQWTR